MSNDQLSPAVTQGKRQISIQFHCYAVIWHNIFCGITYAVMPFYGITYAVMPFYGITYAVTPLCSITYAAMLLCRYAII